MDCTAYGIAYPYNSKQGHFIKRKTEETVVNNGLAFVEWEPVLRPHRYQQEWSKMYFVK